MSLDPAGTGQGVGPHGRERPRYFYEADCPLRACLPYGHNVAKVG
jgi:hypothetical protein